MSEKQISPENFRGLIKSVLICLGVLPLLILIAFVYQDLTDKPQPLPGHFVFSQSDLDLVKQVETAMIPCTKYCKGSFLLEDLEKRFSCMKSQPDLYELLLAKAQTTSFQVLMQGASSCGLPEDILTIGVKRDDSEAMLQLGHLKLFLSASANNSLEKNRLSEEGKALLFSVAKRNYSSNISGSPVRSLSEFTRWNTPAASAAGRWKDLEELASIDDAMAQVEMGFLLQHGLGVPKDVAKAKMLYLKSNSALGTKLLNGLLSPNDKSLRSLESLHREMKDFVDFPHRYSPYSEETFRQVGRAKKQNVLNCYPFAQSEKTADLKKAEVCFTEFLESLHAEDLETSFFINLDALTLVRNKLKNVGNAN